MKSPKLKTKKVDLIFDILFVCMILVIFFIIKFLATHNGQVGLALWDNKFFVNEILPYHKFGRLFINGAIMTIRLSIYSSILALFFGSIVGIIAVYGSKLAKFYCFIYVQLIRNIPQIVFILIFFFLFSIVIFSKLQDIVITFPYYVQYILSIFFGPIRYLSNTLAGIVILGIIGSASIAEYIKSGILSIDDSQWKVAKHLGLGSKRIFISIIFPQVLINLHSSILGQIVRLIKMSALVSLVSVPELTFVALEVSETSNNIFEVWVPVAVIYFLICIMATFMFGLNRKYGIKAR